MRMLTVGSVGWEPTITLHEIKFGGAFVDTPSIRMLNLGRYLHYSNTRFLDLLSDSLNMFCHQLGRC